MALTKITTSVIAANTLATGNIADNSVDATKIASNSILTRHIDDDQITGDQLADNITIAGNLTVSGNLTTNGSSVTNSSTNTTIEDALIELGTGTSGSPSNDSGIIIERGSSDNVFIGFDESADKVMVATTSATGASTGNLTLTAAPLVTGALTASGLSYPTSDGSSGQVLKTDGSGSLSFAANTTSVSNYTATGNGSTTAFDTGTNPTNEINTWVFIDGVYQQKSEYSYSGSTITFSTAPENGAKIDVVTGVTTGIQDSETVLGVFEATTTATDTYATSLNAAHENNTWVFVGGVYQPKDSYTFSTSGSLVFDANTPAGEKLAVVTTKALTASAVTTDSIAASAVTTAKIADNAITSAKIPNNSIVGADISATTNITANAFTGALTGNVTGNVTGNLTGTIQTAAQANITSLGTLTSLSVGGSQTNFSPSVTVNNSSSANGSTGAIRFVTESESTGLNIGKHSSGHGTADFAFINQELNADLAIFTNNTERMRIASDGSATFTKTGTNASPHIKLVESGDTREFNIFNDGSGNGHLVLADSDDDTPDTEIVLADNGVIQFKTGNTERMTVQSTGVVAIGNTENTGYSDDYLVQVGTDGSGSNSFGMLIRANTSGTSKLGFADGADADATGKVWYNHASNYMRFDTAGSEKMRITSDGKVNFVKGIEVQGDTSQSAEGGHIILRANSGGTKEFGLDVDTTNSFRIITEDDGGDANGAARLILSNTGSLQVSTLHGSTASNPGLKYNTTSGLIYYDTSSIRYKENVQDLPNSLEKIKALRPVTFDEKASGESCTGLIAEEVVKEIPELVHLLDVEGYDTPQPNSVDYAKLSVYLLKAVQELEAKVATLESK